jgi:nucleoside-diphosphate-sugar epimerase
MISWGHVNPIGPRACYDEGKRVAETLTYGFHRQDGVDVRVARIFNTYGMSYSLGLFISVLHIFTFFFVFTYMILRSQK